MKTLDELKDYIASHPDWKNKRIRHCLRSHNITNEQIEAARAAWLDSREFAATTTKPTVGQPLSNLLEQFDDVGKVKKAMKALPRDSYSDDDEMRRRAGVSFDRWKTVVEHPTVKPFRYQLPSKKHVWMHPEAQAKLTAAINLDQQ